MNTSAAGDASSGSTSRREKIALAAERRLQEGTTASPSVETRKRKAPPAISVQQMGFSDSDTEDVKGVGVSARTPLFMPESGGAAAGNKCGRKEKMITGTTTAAGGAALGAGATRLEASSAARSSSGSIVPQTPKALRVVSWNIDCLNGENKVARAEEVCAILLESEPTPDVILLQEVDGEMFSILNARLGCGGRYRAFPPRVPVERSYFALVFVNVGTVAVRDSGREDFPNSRMGRDLATVQATFNGKPFLVMTAHLESEKQSSDERKAQFKQALQQLLAFRGGPAIFAGDTNLREAEVKQEKLAKEVGDMWELCGGDPERRFTWDMAKNDNHVFGGGFQPRARYDRMFVSPQAKASARSFALLGTQRMAPPHSCFPSDHFGLEACFEW